MTEAKQTPLPDLLDRVPYEIVLGIPGDEPVFPSYTNIPIGELARQAAAELRRLHEANEAFGKRQEWWNEKMFALEQQRDALLEALKTYGWHTEDCPQHPTYARPKNWPACTCGFDDAIKMVEEGK